MNFAFCIIRTWLNRLTWILTFTINTCLPARAFSIFFTAFRFWWRYWSACNSIWISGVAWSANTNSSMVSWGTICILGTITWINTLFISTCQCSMTIWICQTLWFSTNIVWISDMLWQTSTFRPMVSSITLSIDTASFKRTRVLAFSIDTCLRQGTFRITFTSSYIDLKY